MLMPDVNILVYAHREDEKAHEPYADWLKSIVESPEPFSLSVFIAVGFIRIVTNSRIYRSPTPLSVALAFIEQLTSHPNCRSAVPAAGHLDDVMRLCRLSKATGKLVSDAQHAALAISQGCTFVTRDGDFTQFVPHGLRWQHLILEP